MKKKCELCSQSAQIYCESDNASLCYTCDQTVHSANFLVAKHSRTLLCCNCKSLTPWTASGLNLGQAKTTCANCQQRSSSHIQDDVAEEEGNDHTEYDESSSSDDDESSSDDDESSSDAENQVVPWSTAVSPRVGSCSSSDECSRSQMKRRRFHEFIDSENDIDTEDRDTECSSEEEEEERSSRKTMTEIYNNNRSYF